ncbi:MAG TPA: hypothetical protein VGM49_03535 [Candidatus Limnocylindrales bacterium]|jgi:hypothetical protein
MTKLRLTRTARGAVIALVLTAVWAAPAAATQPVKTTNHNLQPFTIPADMACPFDVEGQPSSGFSAYTEFSNGRLMGSVHAKGDYVNAETGARYPTLDNFHFIQWYDAITGNTYVELEGQAADWFLPGDTGPFGTVGAHGAFYDFVGRITFTIDANGATTQFSWVGTATNICAALS